MKILLILVLAIQLLAAGCSGVRGASVLNLEIEIVNRSSRVLENAQARFGVNICEWGYVAKSASYMFFPHPITEVAELNWVEATKSRLEKIDLRKIDWRGKAGRLTFTVFDDRVEVDYREKSI